MISLSKEVIYARVRLFSSYLAGKRSDTLEGYDRVATDDLDIPLLEYIATQRAAELAARLGPVVVEKYDCEGTLIKFKLRNLRSVGISAESDNSNLLQDAENEVGSAALKSDSADGAIDIGLIYNLMESHIIAASIADWLRIVGYEPADGSGDIMREAASTSEEKLEALKSILTTRRDTDNPRHVIARSRKLPAI